MKKYVLGIVIILAVIFASGCITDGNSSQGGDNSTQINSLSRGGVMIYYPGDWVVSQATSNYSVIAISDSASIDNSNVGQVNINIERHPYEGSFDTFVNQTYTSLQADSGYNLTSSGQVTVGNTQGIQYIYSSYVNGTYKQHQSVWVDQGNEALVITYTAPEANFDAKLNVFEFVLSNLQITG